MRREKQSISTDVWANYNAGIVFTHTRSNVPYHFNASFTLREMSPMAWPISEQPELLGGDGE
jgi:hypothetical protein